ncbi:MAG: MFS transporter, partial [Desulfobulbaceae bacterium]|nr:MFS transporter [Desulfobulbaceae bacterium]
MKNESRSTHSAYHPSLPVGDPRSYLIFFKENPRYKKFWLSGVISQIGNWFNYIAIFVLLTELTGSGMAVSWFLIAKFIPTSFLGPAAGVIADRFSRKTIMIVSDLLRVGVVLCFLFVQKPEYVWLVYFLALVQESIWTFYDPARRAAVPNICASHELHLANALSGATWSIMLALGAAMGGFVTHLFGWETAIVVDAASFVISAWIMSKIDLPLRKAVRNSAPTWKNLTGITAL